MSTSAAGWTTPFVTSYTQAVANEGSGMKFTMPEAGSVESVTFLARGITGTQVMRFALFVADGAAGAPSTYKGLTNELSIAGASDTVYIWRTIVFPSPLSLAAGDYWLLGFFGTTSNYIRIGMNNSTGGVSWDWTTLGTYPTPPNPLVNAPNNQGTFIQSMFVNYTPTTPPRPFVAQATNKSATTSVVLDLSTLGLQVGDWMESMCIAYQAASTLPGAITAPTNWTVHHARTVASYIRFASHFKRYSGEAINALSWGSTLATVMLIGVVVYRGAFRFGNAWDIDSDTAYTTSNTIVRGGTMTTTQVDTVIWHGGQYASSGNVGLGPPANYMERCQISSGPIALLIADRFNVAAGATGSVDGSIQAAATGKHAFMTGLKPAYPIKNLCGVGL